MRVSFNGFSLLFRDAQGGSFQARVDAEGSFSISGLAPGQYEITSNPPYALLYSLARFGHSAPLRIALASGAPVRRDLMLGKAAAEIHGIVKNSVCRRPELLFS